MLNFLPTKEEAVMFIAKTIRIEPAMTRLRVVFRDQGVWRFAAEQNTIDPPFPPTCPSPQMSLLSGAKLRGNA
jgi:hypothetical protein